MQFFYCTRSIDATIAHVVLFSFEVVRRRPGAPAVLAAALFVVGGGVYATVGGGWVADCVY